MEWHVWQPVYLDIVRRLALNVEADRNATALLTSLLRNIDPAPILSRLRSRIHDHAVVVCGAGPSLERHLRETMRMPELQDAVYVAADGAATAFLEQDQNCDVLVTDLDGNSGDLKRIVENGALPIVHAHGDNMDRVKQFVPTLREALGSTQVEPTDRAFLWGGFTDGDRACHIALHYVPRRIVLAGMDFGTMVGRWSKPDKAFHYQADERKRIKLEIARELVSALLAATDVPYAQLR